MFRTPYWKFPLESVLKSRENLISFLSSPFAFTISNDILQFDWHLIHLINSILTSVCMRNFVHSLIKISHLGNYFRAHCAVAFQRWAGRGLPNKSAEWY